MRPGRDISGVALPFVLQRRRSDPARDPCGSRASRRFALACLDRAIATARPAIDAASMARVQTRHAADALREGKTYSNQSRRRAWGKSNNLHDFAAKGFWG